jgi:thiamine transport system ATP-binding protein
MTVRENVAYGLRYRDPPGGVDASERVDAMLDLVDMTGLADRDPESLSGGQQQRVALARALAPGPEVLLLDEPLSALDARLRERLRVRIREIQRELGITTMYVTHDQAEALAISDRIAVVRDGRIQQVGTPEAVYRRPATRFVAEFVGENNVFTAEVTGGDPPRLSVGDASIPVAEVDGLDRSGAEWASRDGTVTVCVRPEDLALGGGDATLSARVDHVEFLGDSYRVHCGWNGDTLRAKTGSEPAGETVRLGFDAGDVTVVGDGAEPSGTARDATTDRKPPET